MPRYTSLAKVFVLIGSVGWLGGCGSDPTPGGCPEQNEIRGVCAGVPQAAVCDGDTCTENVTCSAVANVASDAELQAAAAQATSGTCIALAPGKYGAVSLPGGVSLLGKSAADVTVGQVTVNAGQGAVLRGFTTSATAVSGEVTPTIHVRGATGAKIESVRVSGTAEVGVLVDPQSSVQIVTSSIESPAQYGVFAEDSLEVSLDRVVITGAGGPGLWVASSGDCAMPPAQLPVLNASSSILRGNHVAGIALFTAQATLQKVDILSTVPGDQFGYGKGGGGLSIAECSAVDATGLRVHDSKKFGVLVEASSATIGGLGMDEEVEIDRNAEMGIWIQDVTSPFKMENIQLDQNEGVGIGLGGASQGIVICKSAVTGTKGITLPTTGIDSKDIGDGIVWADSANAEISDVTLSGNALASVLIDGEATGLLARITLSGGDDAKGIVQQNLTMGGAQPMFIDTPAAQVATGEVHPVPAAPAAIPKNL